MTSPEARLKTRKPRNLYQMRHQAGGHRGLQSTNINIYPSVVPSSQPSVTSLSLEVGLVLERSELISDQPQESLGRAAARLQTVDETAVVLLDQRLPSGEGGGGAGEIKQITAPAIPKRSNGRIHVGKVGTATVLR